MSDSYIDHVRSMMRIEQAQRDEAAAKARAADEAAEAARQAAEAKKRIVPQTKKDDKHGG